MAYIAVSFFHPFQPVGVGCGWGDYLVQQGDEGANYIDVVYTRRADAAERGLTYYIELSTNLVAGGWTNDTGRYSVIDAAINAEWHAVTNRIQTEDGQLFIRPSVKYTP
jgi:hypothetical protein